MANWYVNATGSNGDGSEGSPWAGFSSVVWGSGGVEAGDTLNMSGTFTTQVRPADSGSALSRIELLGAGCVIDGEGVINTPFNVNSENSLELRGFEIRNSGSNQPLQLWDGDGSGTTPRDVVVDQCTIHGSPSSSCVHTWGGGVAIQTSLLYDANNDGAWMKGQDARVINCDIRDVGVGGVNGDCIQFPDMDTTGALASFVTGDRSNTDVKQGIICSFYGGDNEISDSVITGYADASANVCLRMAAGNSRVRRNRTSSGLYGVQAAVAPSAVGSDGVALVSNIAANPSGRGVSNGLGVSNLIAAQNTLFASGGDGIHEDANDASNRFVNNIVSGASVGIETAGADSVERYNCVHNTTTPRTVATVAGSLDVTDIALDPQFIDTPGGDFRLEATSPCVRSGALWWYDTPSVQPLDLNGSPYLASAGAKPDVGAHSSAAQSSRLTITPRNTFNLFTDFSSDVLTQASTAANFSAGEVNQWADLLRVDGSTNIFYETDSAERGAEIVPDPVTGRGPALRFWANEGYTPSGDCRIQAQLYDLRDVRDLTCEWRMYLHPDVQLLESEAASWNWFTFQEWWLPGGWVGDDHPFRITLGLEKLSASADTPLTFRIKGEDMPGGPGNSWSLIWAEQPADVVRFGAWYTMSCRVRVGGSSDGRVVWTARPDGGTKSTLADVYDQTVDVRRPMRSAKIWGLNPLKLYTHGDRAAYVRDAGGVMQIYFDDLRVRETVTGRLQRA